MGWRAAAWHAGLLGYLEVLQWPWGKYGPTLHSLRQAAAVGAFA